MHKTNKLWGILTAALVLAIFNLGWMGIHSASAATTNLTTVVPTLKPNAGNVDLGEIWIFENLDQSKSAFTQSPPGSPIDITITILTSGVRFQAIPDVNPGPRVVDVVDPLLTIAGNTIVASDLSLVGTPNSQTYTLRVTPSFPPGSIRGGLQFKFPVFISGAPTGPIEIEISAPDTGITGGRFVAGEQYGILTPAAPEDPLARALSATEIEVSWADNADNEEGFIIERKEPGTEYSPVGQVSTDTKIFLDKGLKSNTGYSYRVRAFNQFGYSAYSYVSRVVTKMQPKVICFQVDQPSYTVNGEVKNMDTVPIILEDRILLPVRYIAETLGAVVDFEPETKKATITLEETVIKLWAGNRVAKVNGKDEAIDPLNSGVVPLIDSADRMLLPVRFIAESLGGKVEWNIDSREVKITID